MTIEELIKNTNKLEYKTLCSALIERFGVKQAVKWDSVLPHEQQQTLFGGEILRLVSEHPTLADQKEIRPVCLMKGDLSQLLFFYVQLKDEKLPKAVIEKITRKFVGGAAADRYIIWFFGSKTADALKVVISGKEGKKIRLKTLSLEAGQWFKTYDYILSEVERKFNTDGLFQDFKEPSGLWKALWDAFDISIVNKKFYAEIKAVFDVLTREELPKCKGLLTNEQDRVQFAIRLIGRIIFCWFLKRKGIITGDVMSSRAAEAEQNYYRDILEPLFFDVFNTPLNERKKDLPESIKNYPFLNGGLFEPQPHDYNGNWALNISNNWFINFFNNTLERYNFTVDENSAVSSEIAIDPEMLGRIFENLLAEQNPETGESARKSTGSYYTPREIVDFMVEESLIAYLKTQKGGQNDAMLYPLSTGAQALPEDALEDFVHTGTLPDSLKSHSKRLFEKLNAVKALDPACGSGAFPISMLQKLAALKQQLDPKASPYALKLKTIENSIYGVDIQPMATELSRLRCWLSLIVDEDPKDIKPLPNLDFKFVTANSLIDLGYDEFIQKVETGKAPGLFLQDFKNKLAELRTVRQKYFDPLMGQKGKDRLKKEFNTISLELLNMSHKLITLKLLDADFANKINSWEPFDDSRPAPFFNSEWMFGIPSPSPFEKGGAGGFDVVIGNPPYVQIQSFSGQPVQKQWEAQKYATYVKTGDIYCLFYEPGFNLLSPHGVLTYITSNKWMRAKYGEKLRQFFKEKTALKQLIDFGGHKVFESATVDTNILIFQKFAGAGLALPLQILNVKPDFTSSTDLAEYFGQNAISISQSDLDARCFTFGNDAVMQLKKKIEQIGTPLKDWDVRIYRGVITGFNEAFIIDNGIKEGLCKEDPKSAEILKPILRGRDIQRYSYSWAGLWLIKIESGWTDKHSGKSEPEAFFKNSYPAVYNHLKAMGEKKGKGKGLYQRDDQGAYWWELRDCVYYEEFEKEKLIYRDVGDNLSFAYDDGKMYVNNTVYFLNSGSRYLLAVMNSSLLNFYYRQISSQLGDAANRAFTIFLEQLPIFKLSEKEQPPFITFVDQILAARQKDPQADTSALEKQIDKMVGQAHRHCPYNGLTPEEIAIVEGENK